MSDGEKVDISKIKPGDKVTLVPLEVWSTDDDSGLIYTHDYGAGACFTLDQTAAHHPRGDRAMSVCFDPHPSGSSPPVGFIDTTGQTVTETRAPDPAVAVLEAEVARLREVLGVIETGDYPRRIATPWHLGGPPSPNDICVHDNRRFRTCEICLREYAHSVLNPAPSEKEAG